MRVSYEDLPAVVSIEGGHRSETIPPRCDVLMENGDLAAFYWPQLGVIGVLHAWVARALLPGARHTCSHQEQRVPTRRFTQVSTVCPVCRYSFLLIGQCENLEHGQTAIHLILYHCTTTNLPTCELSHMSTRQLHATNENIVPCGAPK
jgi:hypothetical protein